MATNKKTFTAPMAIIKSGGVAIGKMKTVRLTEQINRGSVQSLGNLTKEEVPALSYNCSLQCSFYTIDFKESAIPDILNRKMSKEDFINNILLEEDGVQIVILKKTKKAKVGGINQSQFEEFATINSCFPDSESMDITEGSISGRDVSMQYLDPVLYT